MQQHNQQQQQATVRPSPILPQVVRGGQFVLQPVLQNSQQQVLSYALPDGVSPHQVLVPLSVMQQQNASSATGYNTSQQQTITTQSSIDVGASTSTPTTRSFAPYADFQTSQCEIDHQQQRSTAFSRPKSKFRRVFSPPPLSAPPRVITQDINHGHFLSSTTTSSNGGKMVTFNDDMGKELEDAAGSPIPFCLAPTPAQLGLAPGQTRRNSRHSSSGGLPSIGDQKLSENDDQSTLNCKDDCAEDLEQQLIDNDQIDDKQLQIQQHQQEHHLQQQSVVDDTPSTPSGTQKKLFKRQDESMDR